MIRRVSALNQAPTYDKTHNSSPNYMNKKKIKIRQFNTKSKNYKGNFMSFVKYDKESREVDFTTGNPSYQVLEELNIK